jgi:hypothetical protein
MINQMHKFVIYLLIYFCLICFGLSFNPSSEAGIKLRRGSSPGYDVGTRARMELDSSILAQALTPQTGDLNLCRSCTSASEDVLKESPKHVRQK